MNDERMQSSLEEGFKTMDTSPEDVQRSTRQVMERKAHVRQRSRWWPFPVFYRRTQSPIATDTTGYQPSPIPATNGHSPTVIGRTQSMFSPAKAITTGALVFAIGGVLLIAQPFDQQGGSVPGAATPTDGVAAQDAEADSMAPAAFTGTVVVGPSESNRSYGDVVDGRSRDEWEWTFTLKATDPRIAGVWSGTMTTDLYYTAEMAVGPDPSVDILSGTVSFENDAGSWVGTVRGCIGCKTGMFSVELVGAGGYEGLSALVYLPGVATAYGLIVPGDLPVIE